MALYVLALRYGEDQILMSMTCRRFQALLKTYEQLSGLILDTLRIDLRCRAIYYLEAAMRHVG